MTSNSTSINQKQKVKSRSNYYYKKVEEYPVGLIAQPVLLSDGKSI